jgi:uncharacterized iron-regulated membrane protein
MKTFRSVLFWMHLAAGAAAGVVILIMSVTGVALTYEKQMLEWADRAPGRAAASCRPPLAETCWRRCSGREATAPIGARCARDRAAPATLTLEGNKALLVDPYTGASSANRPRRCGRSSAR